MAIDTIFNNIGSIMTVVSLFTFVGILWWVYGVKGRDDFDAIANLPLNDDADNPNDRNTEKHHG